jgi:hypothetical protein
MPPGSYRKLIEQTLFDTAPGFWWTSIEVDCAVRRRESGSDRVS